MKTLSNVLLSSAISLLLILGVLVWQTQSHITRFTPIRQATKVVELVDGLTSKVRGHCSGTVIKEHYVLTAAHCTPEGAKVRVNGHEAILLKTDKPKDLSLLFVNISCPCIPIAEKDPYVDQAVYIVGYPLGWNVQYLTEGRVQGLMLVEEVKDMLAVSTPSTFGNSGGGMFILQKGSHFYEWNEKWVLTSTVSGGAVADFYGFPAIINHMTAGPSPRSIREFLENI